MKRTKLFISLSAFVLILGLGACSTIEFDESEESTVCSPCQTCDGETETECPPCESEGHEHSWSEWEVTIPATCVTTGTATRTCECGESETYTIPLTGHEFDSGTVTQQASCTLPEITTYSCKYCEESYTEITALPLGHEYGEFEIVSEATCDTNGEMRRVCSRCQQEETITLTASGHQYEGWTYDETGHYHVCLKCGEVFDFTEHVLSDEYVIDSEDDRYHAKECECGYKETQVHQVDKDGNCTVCDATKLNVAGFTFAQNEDEDTYYVSAYDMSKSAETVYVPLTTDDGYPVTGVGSPTASAAANSAFTGGTDGKSLNYLKFIGLSDNITTINPYAFYNCYSVIHVEIPDTVQEFGQYAFYQCYSLRDIYIPDGVESLGDYILYDCYGLLEINLPDSIREIGARAFGYCYSVSEIVIPEGVTAISNYTFYNCNSLKSVKLPSTIEKIGDNAFDACYALPEIEIPSAVQSIGGSAFNYCRSLTSLLVVPEGVPSFSSSTFLGCYALKALVIPSTITSIGSGCFRYDYSLTDVFYGGASEEEWNKISITSTNNGCVTGANRWYYDEDGSLVEEDPKGNYWHFDEQGNVVTY